MDRRTRALLRQCLERRWNPGLHPRGPDGRFTKSFARPANSKQRKRINYVRNGPKPKRVRTPAESTQLLSQVAPPPERRGPFDVALAQLRAANQSLRAGRTPPDNAIADSMRPLTEPVQAFRSVPRSEFGSVSPEDLRGFVVRDAGFFPASTAPTAPQPGEVRMEINVPAGTRVAASPDTHELVIDAGTEMSVDDIRANPDGSTVMTLTALPAEGADAADTPDAETPTGDNAATPPDFEGRVGAAASGPAGRDAAPASLIRGSDPPLTDGQLEALEEYQADNYDPVNRMLRGGDPSEPGAGGYYASREVVEEWVDNLDSVMEQSRLATDVQAWRGLDGTRLFGDRLSGDLTGMEFREDAYSSFSTDQSVSSGFARGEAAGQDTPNPNPVLMRVLIPAGVGAVEMSNDQGALGESELLAQRGLTLRIVADNGVDENGVRQIDVEVVPVDA